MAIFQAPCTLNDLTCLLQEFSTENKFKASTTRIGNSLVYDAEGIFEDESIQLSGNVHQEDRLCHIEFHANLDWRSKLPYLVLWLFCIAFFTALLYSTPTLAKFIRSGDLFQWIVIFFILILLLGMFFLSWAQVQQTLGKCESDFKELLEKEFRASLQTVQTSRGNLFSPWIDIVLVSILISFFALIPYRLGILHLVIFAAFSLPHLVLPGAMSALLHRDMLAYWKLGIVGLVDSWCRVYETILMFALILYYINILGFHFGRQDIRVTTNAYRFAQVEESTKILYDPAVFKRNSVDYVQENSMLIENFVEGRVRDAAQSDDSDFSQETYRHNLRTFQTLGTLGLFLTLFILITVMIGQIQRALRKAVEITNTSRLRDIITLKGPPKGIHLSKWSRTGVWITVVLHYMYSATIYLTSLIFLIDWISFVCLGKPVFFVQSAIMFSWISAFAPNKDVALALPIGLTALLGLFLVPYLLVVFVAFANILQSFDKAFRSLIHKNRVPTYITDFVDRVCSEAHISRPWILVTRRKIPVVRTHMGLPLGPRPVVEISRPVLMQYSQQQVIAAVAHELGHIASGLRAMQWLLWLSRVLPFAANYLVLVFDFAKREYMADRFALTATKNDKESLTSVIIAMTVHGMNGSTIGTDSHGTSKKPSSRDSWKALFNFLFGNVLTGYAHPLLGQRLHMIEIA